MENAMVVQYYYKTNSRKMQHHFQIIPKEFAAKNEIMFEFSLVQRRKLWYNTKNDLTW